MGAGASSSQQRRGGHIGRRTGSGRAGLGSRAASGCRPWLGGSAYFGVRPRMARPGGGTGFDVGQGTAVLVRTPERHTLLFDGGPAGCDLAGQLRELGVRKIDLVVISHPHADHFAGLLEALDGLEVDAFVDQVQVVSGGGSVSPAGAPASAGVPVGGGSSAVLESAAAAWWGKGTSGEALDYLELRRELAEDGCRYVLAGTGYSVTVDDVAVRFYARAGPLVLAEETIPGRQRVGSLRG